MGLGSFGIFKIQKFEIFELTFSKYMRFFEIYALNGSKKPAEILSLNVIDRYKNLKDLFQLSFI